MSKLSKFRILEGICWSNKLLEDGVTSVWLSIIYARCQILSYIIKIAYYLVKKVKAINAILVKVLKLCVVGLQSMVIYLPSW